MKWAGQEFFRKLLPTIHMAGLYGQVGHNEESQDNEGRTSHGPAITNSFDEIAEHYWKDDASKTGSSSKDAEGGTASLLEPATDRTNGGQEAGRNTNGATKALGEHELVVLGGQ